MTNDKKNKCVVELHQETGADGVPEFELFVNGEYVEDGEVLKGFADGRNTLMATVQQQIFDLMWRWDESAKRWDIPQVTRVTIERTG